MCGRNVSVWVPFMCPQLGMWPSAQACALTWNQTSDLSVHRLTLSPLSHTSQAQPDLQHLPSVESGLSGDAGLTF